MKNQISFHAHRVMNNLTLLTSSGVFAMGITLDFIGVAVTQSYVNSLSQGFNSVGLYWWLLLFYLFILVAIHVAIALDQLVMYRHVLMAWLTAALPMTFLQLDWATRGCVAPNTSAGYGISFSGVLFILLADLAFMVLIGAPEGPLSLEYLHVQGKVTKVSDMPPSLDVTVPIMSPPSRFTSSQVSDLNVSDLSGNPSSTLEAKVVVELAHLSKAPAVEPADSVPISSASSSTSSKISAEVPSANLPIIPISTTVDSPDVRSCPFSVEAMFAYVADPADVMEISFAKGQLMSVIDNRGRWWVVEHTDAETGSIIKGIAPSNYLKILAE